ncbi:MAG: hypothetical protein WED33_00375 [Bacteroidia bacterium]
MLLLVSRLILFLAFQAIVALLANSWEISEKYWLLSATLTNLVSIALLVILFKLQGENYFSIFTFSRANLKNDLLVFSGLAILTVPVVFLPGYFLSSILWENPNIPTQIMFAPIEKWLVYILLIIFPITISMAEIATYFVYIMPNLKEQFKLKWLAILFPVLFLSVQHCTLPFIPDIDFILYRALVFLPFASLIGISIYYRPSLFIYFAILHGILDFGTALMFLFQIK